MKRPMSRKIQSGFAKNQIRNILQQSYPGPLNVDGELITFGGMHDTLKLAVLAVVFFCNNPVWGSGDTWQVSPKPAETFPYQTSVIPMTDGTPIAPSSVRNLAPETDRPRTQGILATTTWLKGAFATETEVAVNQGGPGVEDPSARMMRLGLIGSTGLVRYGMTYRTADQAFYQGSGHERREAWGEWQSGAMAVRSTVGQRTDFTAEAAGNEQRYSRTEVSWNKAAWPHVALSYAQNAESQTMEALSLSPQKANSHRLEAALGYRGAVWDAKVASGYGLETDQLQHGIESQVNTVMASFRPVDSLSITPTLGYRAEQQEWSGAKTNSPSASLTMKYQQSQRLALTAMGNYFGTRSSDKLVDLDMIGGKGVLTWELEPVRDWKPQVSLEGGYNLQVNRLIPSAQTENLSGLLRLVLATM